PGCQPRDDPGHRLVRPGQMVRRCPTVHCSPVVVFFQSASVSLPSTAAASFAFASNCVAIASLFAPMESSLVRVVDARRARVCIHFDGPGRRPASSVAAAVCPFMGQSNRAAPDRHDDRVSIRAPGERPFDVNDHSVRGKEAAVRYLCLVYVEEKALDGLSEGEMRTLVDESLEYDEVLRK